MPMCRLIPLLKEAMQLSVGKPAIHLVQIMGEVMRPFFMFLCSNCNCDVCDKVRSLGYWSPVETLILNYVLRRYGCQDGKALVVDLGAHFGYFSLISASHGCRVASFQTNVAALRYLNLSRAVNNFENIHLHPELVGQADSEEQTSLNSFGRKLNTSEIIEGNDLNLETVNVTMLDSLLIDENVRLLKIDTEGYEANVLAGAKNLIYSHKVHHILVQVMQAMSPPKRDLLWTIAKTGAYTYVYNWEEIVTPLPVPFHRFRLPNATIVDVTDIVHDQSSTAPLLYSDFWFCRHPLPWL